MYFPSLFFKERGARSGGRGELAVPRLFTLHFSPLK
jgi:hypothetical protein